MGDLLPSALAFQQRASSRRSFSAGDEDMVRSRTSLVRNSEANNTEINQQRRTRSTVYDMKRVVNSSLSSGKLFDSVHSILESPNERGSEDSTDASGWRESSLIRGASGLNTRVRSGWGEELISVGNSRNVEKKEEFEVVIAENDTGRSHFDAKKTDVSSEVQMLYMCEKEAIQVARLESTLPHAAIATAIDESFSSNYRSAYAVLSSWKTRADQGIPVENFESTAAKLLKGTMEEFDNETLSAAGVSGLGAPYRLSIRSKLQEKIEAELKHLFKVHAGLSEIVSIQAFNDTLMRKNNDQSRGDDRSRSLGFSRVSDITYSCTNSDDDRNNNKNENQEVNKLMLDKATPSIDDFYYGKDNEQKNVDNTKGESLNQTRDEFIDSQVGDTNAQEDRTEEEKYDQEDEKLNRDKISQAEVKAKKKKKQKVKKVTLLVGLQRKEQKKNAEKSKGLFRRNDSKASGFKKVSSVNDTNHGSSKKNLKKTAQQFRTKRNSVVSE